MVERSYLELLDEIWRTLAEPRPSVPGARRAASTSEAPAAPVDTGAEQLEFPLAAAKRPGSATEPMGDLPVEELLGGWVGRGSIRALREAGYLTVAQVAVARPEDLEQVRLIGPHRLQQLKTRAVLILHRAGVRAGAPALSGPLPDPMSTALAGLALPPRLLDACRRLGVVSVGDFLRCSPSRLLATRGIGPGAYRRAIHAIRGVLAEAPRSPMSAGSVLAAGRAEMNELERRVAADRICVKAADARPRAARVASELGCAPEAVLKVERQLRRRLRSALEREAAASWHEFLRQLDRRGAIFADSRIGPWRLTTEEIRLLAGLFPQRLTYVETARSGAAVVGLPRARWRWLVRRVRRDAATVREVTPELAQRWGLPAPTVAALVDGLTGQGLLLPGQRPRRAPSGAPDLLDAVRSYLAAARQPVHYREIARGAASAMTLAEAAGGSPEALTRRVRRLLGQRPEFLRTGRGTYLWEGSLARAGYDAAALADEICQLLRRLGVPASPDALSERMTAARQGQCPIPAAVLLRVAARDARFWSGGRAGEPLVGLGSVPAAEARQDHARLLLALLQEAGTPLSVEELGVRLQRHRVLARGEIERALSAEPRIAARRSRGKRLWTVSASSGKC